MNESESDGEDGQDKINKALAAAGKILQKFFAKFYTNLTVAVSMD